ncbi:MAG: GNAT family N-acetyltransferase [Myxococcota bacterium]|nr:GNAT family N-acetyltransferase [Myxococcota bacterium]
MNQPAANLNLDEQRWVIRQASVEDHSVIVSYNLALAEETEGKTLPRAALQAGVQKGLERADLCRYFVVERDGQVVAQAMVTFELTDWRGGIFWWLQSVYVHPRHRQVGVFRRLYNHIEECARAEADVVGLRLYVEDDNVSAQNVYRALGMSSTSYKLMEVEWPSEEVS